MCINIRQLAQRKKRGDRLRYKEGLLRFSPDTSISFLPLGLSSFVKHLT
jgi:hypothetical protein